VTLKAYLAIFFVKKLICTIYYVSLSVLHFKHVKTGGLLRLKSHNFVIFQDNETIFGTYMSV